MKPIVLIVFMAVFAGYSQNDNGKIYFIRSTGFRGSASNNTVFIDKQFVCKLGNDKFTIRYLKPGEHIFTVQFAGKKPKAKAEPITINVEGGKVYYVELILQSDNLLCQEVTENSAKTILVKCTEQEVAFK